MTVVELVAIFASVYAVSIGVAALHHIWYRARLRRWTTQPVDSGRVRWEPPE